MSLSPLHVGIVGCGTTGPAVALFLRSMGHEVEILEQASEALPVGAGFLLQPSGMGVLAELGVLEETLAHGSTVRGLFAQTREGRTLLDLPYAKVREGVFGAGLHRSVLLSLFLRELGKAGVNVKWNVRAMALSEDQRFIIDAESQRHGPYDVIIVADGARSEVRASLKLGERVKAYPWGALWWIGEDEHQDFDPQELYQIVEGTRF
ncbi:MAG: FAD-dependent monooxygenase, partial [Verrucomicrobiota bacterium]